MPAIRKSQRVYKPIEVKIQAKPKLEDTDTDTDTDTNLTKLKSQLLITPKTASILLRIGITDSSALQHLSTNQLLAQIGKQPDVKPSNVEGYRRAARRMVWLGTQSDPGTIAKKCPDWTNKALKARGCWVEGFDDLTGREVDERFGEVLVRVARE